MKSNSLLKELFESFPDSDPPESDTLISHICQECIKLKNDFAGTKWQDVNSETLSEHFNDLPLFTPIGFNYYIPAYIKQVLEQDTAYLTIAEFLIYCLYSKGDEGKLPRFQNRMNQFTSKQISFLIVFLQFLLKDSQYSFISQDIIWSLEAIEQYK